MRLLLLAILLSGGVLVAQDTLVYKLNTSGGSVRTPYSLAVSIGDALVYTGPFLTVSPISPLSEIIITSLAEPQSEMINVSIYPNPTKDWLSIASLSMSGNFQLMDSRSAMLQEGTWPGELSISNLPPGLYLLRLENSEKVISTFRIIKK